MAKPQRFITEDKDILATINKLCMHHKISTHKVDFKDYNGEDSLLASIDTEIQNPEVMTLAVVIDADEDLISRWQSLKNTLSACGYQTVPATPDPAGTILFGNRLPILGIWLMPNNQQPGMVEDFIAYLIPSNDRLWPRAQRVVQQIPEPERNFNRIIKAQIRTWLAWQKEPGRPFGTAIESGDLDANAPHAQQFVDWLRRLFDIEVNSLQ